jgi:hypothetical protein
MTLNNIVAKMAVNNTRMSLDIIVEFIPRVTLLTSSLVTWRKEHIWNVSGHQRVTVFFFTRTWNTFNADYPQILYPLQSLYLYFLALVQGG